MKTTISEYPNSYLKVELNESEKIIVERGAMILSDGDYELKTKFEIKTFNNWIGKIFEGKSIAYNIYKLLSDKKEFAIENAKKTREI